MYENIAKDMVKESVTEDEASIFATPAAFLTSEDDAIAKDMVKESVTEDEASIIATPAAFLTSEDDASFPDEISTAEEDSSNSTPVVTFDSPPQEKEPNSFFNYIDLEDEGASSISSSMVTSHIPPGQEPNLLFDFEEGFEDLENIELQELPEEVIDDPEIDDPECTVNNTDEKLACFSRRASLRCMQRGLRFSQGDIILEDFPLNDEDVFNNEFQLTIFPIERSCRPRIFYPSTEREDDELEFRRNLLEDIPI